MFIYPEIENEIRSIRDRQMSGNRFPSFVISNATSFKSRNLITEYISNEYMNACTYICASTVPFLEYDRIASNNDLKNVFHDMTIQATYTRPYYAGVVGLNLIHFDSEMAYYFRKRNLRNDLFRYASMIFYTDRSEYIEHIESIGLYEIRNIVLSGLSQEAKLQYLDHEFRRNGIDKALTADMQSYIEHKIRTIHTLEGLTCFFQSVIARYVNDPIDFLKNTGFTEEEDNAGKIKIFN